MQCVVTGQGDRLPRRDVMLSLPGVDGYCVSVEFVGAYGICLCNSRFLNQVVQIPSGIKMYKYQTD